MFLQGTTWPAIDNNVSISSSLSRRVQISCRVVQIGLLPRLSNCFAGAAGRIGIGFRKIPLSGHILQGGIGEDYQIERGQNSGEYQRTYRSYGKRKKGNADGAEAGRLHDEATRSPFRIDGVAGAFD